ncbi:hypothetical protein AK830_g10990 [Neonectria ditissima]|uniref:Uncharacterized protein n=1 Tax=Neonectria ditissima TaxID=78410 RepID=A0A0P7AEB4_9HYPO|nr:hypothetical protein AK830_g10990 [Neonectria ditissima]
MGSKLVYEPLGPREIRLLHLQPGEQEIHITLEPVSLDDNPEYEAISYCWGETVDMHTVYCGDASLQITNSLFTALKRLRLPNRPRTLWADAVCIDQSDIPERIEQVQLMNEIYSRPSRVLIWLGDDMSDLEGIEASIKDALTLLPPETHDSDVLREASQVMFREAARLRKEGKPNFNDHNWTPINNLLCRPWFERKWIIQEVIMADDSVPRLMLCGELQLSWEDLASIAYRLSAYGLVTSISGQSIINSRAPCMVSFFADGGRPMRALGNACMIMMLKHYRSQGNLMDCVVAASAFKCTDPRDHVYSLLTLPQHDSGLEPDYNLSIKEAIKQFACKTLERDQNLKVLGLAPHGHVAVDTPVVARLNLPSWVPDLTAQGSYNPQVSYTIRPQLFFAGGSLKKPIRISKEGTLLHLEGRFVDKVKAMATSLHEVAFPSDADIAPKQGIASRVKMWMRNWIQECSEIASGGGFTSLPASQRPGFAKAMLCETMGMRDPVPEEVISAASVYMDYLCDYFTKTFTPEEIAPIRETLLIHGPMVEQSLMVMASSRRFCTTEQSRFGQVRKEAVAGDLFCVISGAEIPYLLRPAGRETYTLIGEAYLLGVMKGEALSDDQYEEVDICLGKIEDASDFFSLTALLEIVAFIDIIASIQKCFDGQDGDCFQFSRKKKSPDTDLLADGASVSRSSTSSKLFSFPRRAKPSPTTPVQVDDGLSNPRGPLGLNLLHSPSEPEIDLIFVHGLGGCSRKTWCKDSNYWPQDWLPKEPALNNVRVLSYGYDSDYLKGTANCLNIHHIGKSFLGDLSTSPYLVSSKTRIIAIGHSMGGLVIKKAYILAKQDAAHKPLAARFAAIYFLATPHRGADSAKLLSNILRVAYDRAYVADLGRNSAAIQIINDEFRHFSASLELRSFYETQNMKHFSSPIVDPESAILGYPGEKQMPMNADHRTICKFATKFDANYVILRNALGFTVDHIRNGIPELELREKSNQMRDLKNYLGVSEVFDDDFLIVKEKRLRNSCQWISSKSSLIEWKDGKSGNNKVFCISGRPATGKSVVAGYVVDSLLEAGHSCSYFFFKDGDKSKSELGVCLRSLAFQMASSDKKARDAILDLKAGGTRLESLDERTLWRALFLRGILEKTTTQHFWVIDALDECSNTSTVFDAVFAGISNSARLRILVTSRDRADLNQGFSELSPGLLQSIAISASDTLPDLKLLIEQKIEALAVVRQEDRAMLAETILDKSKGSFLWTILVLKELRNCHSKKEMHQILAEVPRGMEALYKRTLDSMSRAVRGKELSQAVLMWAVCSIRPMTAGELNGALTLDIEDEFPNLKESIAALCGELVVLDKFGRLQMVHETAREFLLNDNLQSDFAIDKKKSHTRMAESCLRYLVGDEMKPPRTSQTRCSTGAPKKRADFAVYACTAYSYHLSMADPSAPSLFRLVEKFLESNILTWIEACAETKDLSQLIRASKHLSIYLNGHSFHDSLLREKSLELRRWATDLVQIAANFASALTTSPSAIYSLIPPCCPTSSLVYSSGREIRKLNVIGALREQWDDRVSCINLHEASVTALSYGDEFLAISFSKEGTVVLYHRTSHQEYKVLDHGEWVSFIRFKANSDLVVTCGSKRTKVWDIRSGNAIYRLESPNGPLDMDFHGNMLLVASQQNHVHCWDLDKDALQQSPRPWGDTPKPSVKPLRQCPSKVTISVGHEMLAAAYLGQPILLWDLREDSYYGTCAMKYPSGKPNTSRVETLAFNPNPDIKLLVVAYHDGNLALLDPFQDRQLECIRVNCTALAVSSNGRFLATTGVTRGMVYIYEFNTLRLLCRVGSASQSILKLCFSRDNLRIVDVRHSQCSVWEPALLQDSNHFIMSNDNEAASEPVTSSVSLKPLGEITTILAHPTAELIFCGKDNGMVLLYCRKTAAFLRTLFTHKSSVRLLLWCKQKEALLSVDNWDNIFMHKIQVSPDEFGLVNAEELFQFKFKVLTTSTIISVFVAEAAGKLVVSTLQSDHMFTMDGLHERDQVYSLSAVRKWNLHPTSPLHLVCVDGIEARIYRSTDWSELSTFPLSMGSELCVQSSTFFLFGQQQRLLVQFSDGFHHSTLKDLVVFDASEMVTEEHATSNCKQAAQSGAVDSSSQVATETGKIVTTISPNLAVCRRIVLTDGVAHIIIDMSDSGKLIFISHSSWVCSVDLGQREVEGRVASSEGYFRHFFIPDDWFPSADTVCTLAQNDVVFARRGELVVFRECFEQAEEVKAE